MNELIHQASILPCTEWSKIDELIELAEDVKTKQILESIQKRKYHEEEYYFG